jgi:hypothetical protein
MRDHPIPPSGSIHSGAEPEISRESVAAPS